MIELALACLLMISSPGKALAQDDPTRSGDAEGLFQEAHALLKQARYRESCNKFAESQRLEPASGTLLALAYCEERDGRLASAWHTYREAVDLATKEADEQRKTAATERAAALLPRLSTLTVSVPRQLTAAQNLRIARDGSVIERTLWGTALPVDGGEHVLEASADGRRVWSFTVTVRSEGDHQTVTISDLRVAHEERRETPRHRLPQSLPGKPAVASKTSSRKTLGHIGLGLGVASVVSLGIGTTLAFVANSKNQRSNSDGHCDARGCDARGAELRNGALTAARWATVSIVAGGVLAGSSLTVFLVSNNKSAAAGRGTTPHNALMNPGVGMSGRF